MTPKTLSWSSLTFALLIAGAAIAGTQSPKPHQASVSSPPVQRVVAPDTGDDAIEARIRTLVDLDIDHWIHRATLGGPLTYYNGDLSDHLRVTRYLVQHQALPDPDNPEIDYRQGSWVGDNRSWETFDEGCHGRAMLVLASALDQYGNIWNFPCDDGSYRDVRTSLFAAASCALLNQFSETHHDFPDSIGWYGIPGPWPQSPGWRTEEAKFPLIAGSRTYNDAATSDTVLGLLAARIFIPELRPMIDESVELCGIGTRMIQQRNFGGLPEQCDAWGVPLWGRGHEPPSVSPRATSYALRIYLAAHTITDDPKWLVYCVETTQWLEETEVGDKEWEHFLEPDPLLPPSQWRPIWGNGYFNLVYNREDAFWPTSTFGSLVREPAQAIGTVERYFMLGECVADLDGDGDTDVYDFGIFISVFGESGGSGDVADYDADGDVDVFDFGAMVNDFGCAP